MPKIRKRVPKKRGIDRPEEFFSFYEKIIEYIRRRKRTIFFISGTISILIITLAIIFSLNFYYNSKASALEYEAFRFYSVDKPYPDIKISVEERYKKSLGLYQEIVLKYPRTKKTSIALYGVGNCHFQLKNYDEAEKSYKLFIERHSENNFILPLVYQKLGYLYKVRGKTEDALKYFEKIISFEAGLKDLAYTEMGRIYEAQGKQEEAIKNYQKIVEGFPSSPWFSEAKRRLENLRR